MQRFRNMMTLQKFSSVHAQVHNHFNQERHHHAAGLQTKTHGRIGEDRATLLVTTAVVGAPCNETRARAF
jgi:hypothetical protein